MTRPVIHQLVHGYSKGHTFLAGSCRLPKKALDVVTEQSDLSGPLPTSASMPAYLTAYAVPATEYFALGRTWMDDEAPRAGCVITHTLLISKSEWAATQSPKAFLNLHRKPSRAALMDYQSSIGWVDVLEEDHPKPLISSLEAKQLASKVFSDGFRSILWFDCKDSENIFASFVKLLWPALRVELFASTYSLHPHAKVDCALQLHFAPRNAQSRFSRIPKECQITNAGHGIAGDGNAPWLNELATYLERGAPSQDYLEDVRRFGHLLGTEPTGARSLFVLRELNSQVSTTPAAAVGILDVIESLEPLPDKEIESKRNAVTAAISAATTSEPEAALHCFALIDARLRRQSFSQIGQEVADNLCKSVFHFVVRDPEFILTKYGKSIPVENSPFWNGVRSGIVRVAHDAPGRLNALGPLPVIASFVCRAEPEVTRIYLRTMQKNRSTAISEVTEWVRRVENETERRQLRQQLLTESCDEPTIPLLQELLRDLNEDEVFSTLSSLQHATEFFSRPSVNNVISNFVCERFPTETIRWAIDGTRMSSMQVATVIITAFPLSLEGLDRVLHLDWKSPERRCYMWAAYVERAFKKHLPQWFLMRASNDPAVIEPFVCGSSILPEALDAITIIGRECEYVPIAKSPLALNFLTLVVDSPIHDTFLAKLITSAITEFIAGNLSVQQMTLLLDASVAVEWQRAITVPKVQELIVSVSDSNSWSRAWIAMLALPRELFAKVIRSRVLSTIAQSYRARWTDDLAQTWSKILVRGTNELADVEALRLMMEAVTFCFNHPHLPVESVIRTAFEPVYSNVAANKHNHITEEMFGLFDWDKAKKLRKDLIDAFVSSYWPPEDLAIIAARSQILRKIFNRLRRSWRGDEYIVRIVDGLKRRDTPEALVVWRDLTAMMQDPDFFESWD